MNNSTRINLDADQILAMTASSYDPKKIDPATYLTLRYNQSKAIVSSRLAAKEDGDHEGGYSVIDKLSDKYLSYDHTDKKFDRFRKGSVVETKYYKSGDPTCLSIKSNENHFMHGFSANMSDAQAGGECPTHQDYMSDETFVMAFAIVKNGLRAMMQLTMRFKGEGNLEKAASILREDMLGERVKAEEI